MLNTKQDDSSYTQNMQKACLNFYKTLKSNYDNTVSKVKVQQSFLQSKKSDNKGKPLHFITFVNAAKFVYTVVHGVYNIDLWYYNNLIFIMTNH